MTTINTNTSKAKIAFRIIFALMALAIMAYIFFLSCETAAESSQTSSGLIKKIANTFVPSYKTMSPVEKNEFVESLQDIVRKLAHISIFSALGVSVSGFAATFKGKFWLKLLFCQLFCSVYAFSDEFHQKFSSGRSFQYSDIAYDSVGAFAGIVFVLLIALLFCKKGNPKMKKKYLEAHVEALTAKLMEADDYIKELNDVIIDKDNEISLLNKKMETMAQNQEIIKESDSFEAFDEPADEITEEVAENEEVTQSVEEAAPINLSDLEYSDFTFSETEDAQNSEDIETYAVKVISKIITESVKIGCVLASANIDDKKELLNLALGRTEVAKNEISTLVSSDLPDELIKASIDKEAAEVAEYYQSILAQI